MEYTKNDLPKDTKLFFKQMGDYLDCKILFYGSVQRSDFIPGHSDIDVVIFTDNENTTITKLQHFLHVKKTDFKKTQWKFNNKNGYGYKIKYKNKNKLIDVEISIYNEKFTEIMTKKYISQFDLPIYVSILLYLFKIFYYRIKLISKSVYIYLKNYLLNQAIGITDDRFIILESL